MRSPTSVARALSNAGFNVSNIEHRTSLTDAEIELDNGWSVQITTENTLDPMQERDGIFYWYDPMISVHELISFFREHLNK